MEKVIMILSLIAFGSVHVYATEIPHYSKVLEAQRKCSPALFSQMSWQKNQGIDALQTNKVEIISAPEITEIKLPFPDGMKSRTFKVKYKAYAFISCANKTPQPFPIEGKLRSFTFSLQTYKSDQMSLVVEGNEKEVTKMETSANLFTLQNGFHCVMYLEDLIKSPSLFPMNEVCKGASSAKVQATQKALTVAIEGWKNTIKR